MRAYAAAADVVNKPPIATTSFVDGMLQFSKQNAIFLLAAGIIGLIARPPFKFQDKGFFHYLYRGGALLSIGLGAYGFFKQ